MEIKTVLVLDPVGKKCTEILRAHGFHVTRKHALTEIELMEIIDGFDALVVDSITKITMNIIRFALNMKVIVCAGANFYNIDLYAVMYRKIGVLNCPRSGIVSASEFCCGLLMMLARRLIAATSACRAGTRDRPSLTGNELNGSTLALIGLGEVAKEVAIRMHSFGMNIIGHDDFVETAECKRFHIQKMKLLKILPLADYIILFVPPFATAPTFITTGVLKSCKTGVKIIIIGHMGSSQAREMHNGLMAGLIHTAVFDTYDEQTERDVFKLDVFQHPSVIITSNLATQTEESMERASQEAAEQLVNLCKPGTFPTPLSVIVRNKEMKTLPLF